MSEDTDYSDLSVPEQARKYWHDGTKANHEQREAFDERMRFRAGDQWKEEDIAHRGGKERPAIVVDSLEQPIQQIINSNLKNKPGGQVSPADDEADAQAAEFWQGRIRHIEYESGAQHAYGLCIGYVATGGHGLIGLTVDYTSLDSFDQEPRVRAIDNPANWILGPAKELDGRDRRWAIGRCPYTIEEFKRLWPDAQVIDASWFGEDTNYAEWCDVKENLLWVAEYWRLDYKKRKLQRFSNGQAGFLDDETFLANLEPGAVALPGKKNAIEKDYPVVTQYLCSGAETLDETEWKGTRIPIYEVVANRFYSNGKRVDKSAISDSLESQRTYNCSESLKLESLVMAPKPKWLVSVEQIAGHEQEWRTANTSHDAALFYNGTSDSRGNPVPPPDWRVFVPPVQQFQLVSDGAKQDVKLQTGFFDAALGSLDPQAASGKAITALQQQTGLGTIHYAEGLAFMLKALYEDIIDIDRILMTKNPRSMRVIGANGKHSLTRINDPAAQNPVMPLKGKHSVVISIGPTQETQRAAAADFIDTVAEHDPAGWALIRDIGARIKEADLGHFSEEIAARWLPPQFAEQDPNAPPLPPQAQHAMMMLPQLQQENQQLKQIISQKQIEQDAKFKRDMAVEAQKYQTEQLRSATQLATAELQAKNETYLAEIDSRMRALEAAADRGHQVNMQSHKQAHEHAMATTERVHEQHLQQTFPPPEPANNRQNGPNSQ